MRTELDTPDRIRRQAEETGRRGGGAGRPAPDGRRPARPARLRPGRPASPVRPVTPGRPAGPGRPVRPVRTTGPARPGDQESGQPGPRRATAPGHPGLARRGRTSFVLALLGLLGGGMVS
ncbi:MAG: hypothetical protein ACYCPF_14845, partial [Streptosporangiaceae bacterium]